MVSRGTVYPVTTETPARVLAHLIRLPANLTSRALVDVCEHTHRRQLSTLQHVAVS